MHFWTSCIIMPQTVFSSPVLQAGQASGISLGQPSALSTQRCKVLSHSLVSWDLILQLHLFIAGLASQYEDLGSVLRARRDTQQLRCPLSASSHMSLQDFLTSTRPALDPAGHRLCRGPAQLFKPSQKQIYLLEWNPSHLSNSNSSKNLPLFYHFQCFISQNVGSNLSADSDFYRADLFSPHAWPNEMQWCPTDFTAATSILGLECRIEGKKNNIKMTMTFLLWTLWN